MAWKQVCIPFQEVERGTSATHSCHDGQHGKKKNLDEKQFSTVVATRLVCEYKVHKTCDCYLCQLQELFLSMMEVK